MATEPFRRFKHPDGRRWQVKAEGPVLQLRIDTGDGEWLDRKRTFPDANAARKEEQVLAAQQVADGFVETSTSRWVAFLESRVEDWKSDDPSFDAQALCTAALALPDASKWTEALMVLSLDGGPFARGLPAALPVLLLGLKHPEHDSLLAVHGVLSKKPQPAALPALMSALANPPPNRAGGRPHVAVADVIHRLGKPTGATAEKLIALLAHEDFRVATDAAAVLAEYATDDVFSAALVAFADKRRDWDGACWALMRAAEVRRDRSMRPFLEWMLNGRRFRSAGYQERLREALEDLR